jgi:hypothetical protein
MGIPFKFKTFDRYPLGLHGRRKSLPAAHGTLVNGVKTDMVNDPLTSFQ